MSVPGREGGEGREKERGKRREGRREGRGRGVRRVGGMKEERGKGRSTYERFRTNLYHTTHHTLNLT